MSTPAAQYYDESNKWKRYVNTLVEWAATDKLMAERYSTGAPRCEGRAQAYMHAATLAAKWIERQKGSE